MNTKCELHKWNSPNLRHYDRFNLLIREVGTKDGYQVPSHYLLKNCNYSSQKYLIEHQFLLFPYMVILTTSLESILGEEFI